MENRKRNIEELQAELTLEAEALATLQLIYAEKVKQVRINTLLPPDIQARFLGEWETFYQQRMTAIFRKDYLFDVSYSSNNISERSPSFQMLTTDTPPTPVAVMPVSSSPVAPLPTPAPITPVAPVLPPNPPQIQAPPILNRAMAAPTVPSSPIVSSPAPPASLKRNEPPSISASPVEPILNQEPTLTDDILGVDTGSWMNPSESIGYEQYSDSEPISSTLMDSDKIQSSNDNVNSAYDSVYDEDIDDESDSIDGFAATSGLKGLTEFMDFDLKRKKS